MAVRSWHPTPAPWWKRSAAGRHLIDPHDTDGWFRAMVRVLSDEDWRQSLRVGVMAMARPYTWGPLCR